MSTIFALAILKLIICDKLGLIWLVSELADHLAAHGTLRRTELGADFWLKEERDDDGDDLVRKGYLDKEVDDHDDAAALLDASFPGSQVVVVVAVDDDEVDEDEPENVDDQREDENHHHDVLVALWLTKVTLR